MQHLKFAGNCPESIPILVPTLVVVVVVAHCEGTGGSATLRDRPRSARKRTEESTFVIVSRPHCRSDPVLILAAERVPLAAPERQRDGEEDEAVECTCSVGVSTASAE